MTDDPVADWLDEATEAATSGNPRRAFYLEHMAAQMPRLEQAAATRAVAERRTWPPPEEKDVQEAQRRLDWVACPACKGERSATTSVGASPPTMPCYRCHGQGKVLLSEVPLNGPKEEG